MEANCKKALVVCLSKDRSILESQKASIRIIVVVVVVVIVAVVIVAIVVVAVAIGR